MKFSVIFMSPSFLVGANLTHQFTMCILDTDRQGSWRYTEKKYEELKGENDNERRRKRERNATNISIQNIKMKTGKVN